MSKQVFDIISALHNRKSINYVKFDLSNLTDQELDDIFDSANADKIKFILNNVLIHDLKYSSLIKIMSLFKNNKNSDCIEECTLFLDKFDNDTLHNLRDDKYNNILHWFCSIGHVQMVEYLLGRCLHPDPYNSNVWTPLHYAITSDQISNKQDRNIIIERLIQNGSNIIHKDNENKNALVKCIESRRSFDTFKLIAENVNLLNNLHTEMVDAAVACNRLDIVVYLFKRNVYLNSIATSFLAKNGFDFSLN